MIIAFVSYFVHWMISSRNFLSYVSHDRDGTTCAVFELLLNYCIRFRETNLYDTDEKADFSEIFSTDIITIRDILPKIEGVWNMKNAHGTMAK